MADAQLEVLIEAQAAQAKAELQSLGVLVKELQNQHLAAAKAAETHSNFLTGFEQGLGKVGSAAKSLATGALKDLAHGVEDMVGKLAGALNPLNALGAGIAGLGAAFGVYQLVKQAEDWDSAIEKLTPAMNGNAQAAAQWLAVGQRFGLQSDELTVEIDRLSKAVLSQSPVFHNLGIATVDANGHFLDMNTILLNVSDALQKHKGSTDLAALSMELFGRSGASMLPVLLQQRSTLQAVIQEAQAYGYTLGGGSLEQQLAFSQEVNQGEFALKGFETALGNALMVGIGPLMNGLAGFISGPGSQFVQWVRMASQAVVDFIAGFTGMKVTMDPTAEAIGKAVANANALAARLQDAGTGAKDFSAAERAVEDAAKSATEALDAQIQKIRDQATAFEDSINAQIKALQDAGNLESFNDKQAQLRQELADKQLEIARDQQDEQFALYYGDYQQYAAAQAAVKKAKEDATNITTELQKNADDQQRQSQIDRLKAEEDAEKKHTDALIAQLETRKKAIQDAAQKQVEAMQAASAASTAAIVGGMQKSTADIQSESDEWPPIGQLAGHRTGTAFGDALDEGAGTGARNAGETVRAWFDTFSKDPGGHLAQVGLAIGEKIGEGIIKGIEIGAKAAAKAGGAKAAASIASGTVGGPEAMWEQIYGSIVNAIASAPSLSFDYGGTVPGPVGAPVPATVHGGEVVLSNDAQGRMVSLLTDIATTLRSINAGYSAPSVGHLAGAL